MASRVTPFTFPGPAGSIEALWKEPETAPRGSAVVAHAHPLHGGTMHFKVVFRIARALSRAAFGVLRFNFRGVGASQGAHDGGRGEREDFHAALEVAASRGGTPMIAAGFSFGATVALSAGAADPRVISLVGAGLPLEKWRFEGLERVKTPTLLVSGGRDEFADAADLEREAKQRFPSLSLEVLPGADHFFTGHLDWLEARVFEFASRIAPAVEA